ncbi:MAG: SecDF P1 head subdomain-containing protein [Planctomycetaceae bacterium]
MTYSTRSKSFRVIRSACLGMALCLFFLASCAQPPTLESVGGVVLEFAVDETAATQPPSKEVLARSLHVIRARLDPRGDKGVTVRVTEKGTLEVGLPGANADERRQAIALLSRLGSLEFAVMANLRDHRSLIESALNAPADKDEVERDGAIVATWHQALLQPNGQPVDLDGPDISTRQVQRGGDAEVRQFLLIRERDDERVTGAFLTKVTISLDEMGSDCINLTFNQEGARRVSDLTSRNRPALDGFKRRLAIVFDGRIHSAPNIVGMMSDQCQITGGFSRQELEQLVAILNSGVLEVPLNPTPVSERVASPQKSGAAP